MDIFDVFGLIGGLCLFLFGMKIMGESLERKAGSSLRSILGKLTTNKAAGFLTGLGVTAVIQSSSATTVMVVGFVNSGIMTLSQSIMVIMGSNIGTTVTAWMLSLVGVEGESFITNMFKPACFSPILALIGIALYMFAKKNSKKDIGLILLGFSTLMSGMETMSASVSGLQETESFFRLFLMFSNPLLGMLAGIIITAIIQSSSASTGILQALSATGQITYGSAVPIIIGQNIGTCATTLISCIGASRNAVRSAFVHLFFNVFGSVFFITVYCIIRSVLRPVILDSPASAAGIALIHSMFNIICVLLLMPFAGYLEKLVMLTVPNKKAGEKSTELDERLLVSPSIAIQRSHDVSADMAIYTALGVRESLTYIGSYVPSDSEKSDERAKRTAKYKSDIDNYLIRISEDALLESASEEVAMMFNLTGELYSISKQSGEIVSSARKIAENGIRFSDAANAELDVMKAALTEALRLTLSDITGSGSCTAGALSVLSAHIKELRQEIHMRHVKRLQSKECTSEAGTAWMDIITAMERIADHCVSISEYSVSVNGKDSADNVDIAAITEKYRTEFAI